MAKKAKVLLLKPLQGKGNAGEVIDVKMHYANYVLIPQGIAVYFDKQVQNQHAAHKKSVDAYKADMHAKVSTLVADLEANGLTYTKAVTETGTLYDSVTNKSVLQEFKKEKGIILSNEALVFEKIEAVGEYDATLTYEDLTAKFKIVVQPEGKED